MTIRQEAKNRIRAFRSHFRDLGYGDGHFWLLCHAAFPIAITPELLYRIWNNFRQIESEPNEESDINRVAVADVLLWSAWRETATEVFELDEDVRSELLLELKTKFGEERQKELAQFLYQYTTQSANRSTNSLLMKAQLLGVQATLAPQQAARQLETELRESISKNNQSEILRLRNLVGALASQHADFEPLLSITKGLKAAVLGMNPEVWQRQFDQAKKSAEGDVYGMTLDTDLADNEPYLSIPLLKSMEGAVNLPKRQDAQQPKNVFLLVVGIDDYKSLQPTTQCVNNANLLVEFLPDYYTSTIANQTVHKQLLTNREATRASIIFNFGKTLQQAQSDDTVIFIFLGHGQPVKSKEALLEFIYTYERDDFKTDLSLSLETRTGISETEFRETVEKFGRNNPHVILIMDANNRSFDWLSSTNPKHVILSSGTGWEEVVERGGKPHGVFTAAFIQALRSSPHPQTYYSLIRKIYQTMQVENRQQIPQIFGIEKVLRRPFLSTDDSEILYLQELGKECGYYDGPINGVQNEQMLSLNRIKDEYETIPISERIVAPVNLNPVLLEEFRTAFEQLAISLPANKFSMVCLGVSINDDKRQWIEIFLSVNPFPIRITFEELKGRQNRPSKKANISQKDSSNWERPLPELMSANQALVLFLTNTLTQQPGFLKWANQLVHYARFEHKLLFPVLLEPCQYHNSSLRQVKIYSASGQPIYLTEAEALEVPIGDTKNGFSIFRQIRSELDPYSIFYQPKKRNHLQKIDFNWWTNAPNNFQQTLRLGASYKFIAPDTHSDPFEQYQKTTASFQELIQMAITGKYRMRAVGAGWSFSKVAISDGGIVETSELTLSFPLDKASVSSAYLSQGKTSDDLYFSQCGVQVLTLAKRLESIGKSLRTVGAHTGQTIAGAISTGTHGAALDVGALHDTVVGLHLITGPDRHVWLERESYPVVSDKFIQSLGITTLLRNDTIFDSALVSFGSFGFIHGVLLEVEPIFSLQNSQSGFVPYTSRLKRAMTDLFFRDIPIRLPADQQPYHFELLINAFQVSGQSSASETGLYLRLMTKHSGNVTHPTQPPHPVFSEGTDSVGIMGAVLTRVSSTRTTQIAPTINSLFSHAMSVEPVSGPLSACFGTTQVPHKLISSAFGIDAKDSPRVLDEIIALNQQRPFPGLMSMRWVKATRATLGFTRFPITCVLELDGRESSEAHQFFQRLATQLDAQAIPYTLHWGMVNDLLDEERVRLMYTVNQVDAWLHARQQLLDAPTRAVFTNEFMERCGLDKLNTSFSA